MAHAQQLDELSREDEHSLAALRGTLHMATLASTASSFQPSHTSAGRTAAALKAASTAAAAAAAAAATSQPQTSAGASSVSGQTGAGSGCSSGATSAASSSTTVLDEEEEMECRICRCGEYDGKLLFPCSCRAPVHMYCLEKWIRRKNSELFPLSLSYAASYQCEVCLKPYNLSLLMPRYKLARHKLCGYCSVNLTIELALFLSTLCLTCVGLAILWSHMYGPDEGLSSPLERLTLGLMNSALTASLFILFHRLALRFRSDGLLLLDARIPTPPAPDTMSGFGPLDTAVTVEPLSVDEAAPERSIAEQYQALASRFLHRVAWNYVILGAGLGTTAAFEVYLIIRSL